MIADNLLTPAAFSSAASDNLLSAANKTICGKASASTRSKKSLLARKKSQPYPNKETQWSYFMQAIEPSSLEINIAFPGYHPMWIIQSQRKTVSAEYFRYMRDHLLKITRKECAAYLSVTIRTIQEWEIGKTSVPFMAFELLRMVYESANFRLSNKDWQGWFIADNGRLVSPDRGNLSFSPDELSFIRETHQVKSMYQIENEKLRAELEPLRAEIEELRAAASNDNGLLFEIQAIQSKLIELSNKVVSNKVVNIRTKIKTIEYPLKEKAA